MEKRKTNGTTLDVLANMVASGFEGVDKRFDNTPTKDEISDKFHEVNQRIGKVEYRIDEIYDILARFEEGDILDLQKRIKILERAMKVLAKQLG